MEKQTKVLGGKGTSQDQRMSELEGTLEVIQFNDLLWQMGKLRLTKGKGFDQDHTDS